MLFKNDLFLEKADVQYIFFTDKKLKTWKNSKRHLGMDFALLWEKRFSFWKYFE